MMLTSRQVGRMRTHHTQGRNKLAGRCTWHGGTAAGVHTPAAGSRWSARARRRRQPRGRALATDISSALHRGPRCQSARRRWISWCCTPAAPAPPAHRIALQDAVGAQQIAYRPVQEHVLIPISYTYRHACMSVTSGAIAHQTSRCQANDSTAPTPGSEAEPRLPVGSERAPLPMLQAGSRWRSDSSCRLPGLSVS
jgi:hypothetical protein